MRASLTALRRLSKVPGARRSYSGLSAMPPWGLFKDGKLIATVRAGNIGDASDLFRKHHLAGDVVVQLEDDNATKS